MSRRIVIADVLYTETDETFYVLKGKSKFAERYVAETTEKCRRLLEQDGWSGGDSVCREPHKFVELWQRRSEYLAIWEEAE